VRNKYGFSYVKTAVVKNNVSTIRSPATLGNASSYSPPVSSVPIRSLHYYPQITNVESELREQFTTIILNLLINSQLYTILYVNGCSNAAIGFHRLSNWVFRTNPGGVLGGYPETKILRVGYPASSG
jgi:hypothetical protein